MAMKDLKSIEVAPSNEEKTVQLWMSFGWELKNNQRVKTSDVQKYTGQDSEGTKYYETTRGVDFIKLTFERDPERKNYAELVELEKQYYNISIPDPLSPPGERPGFGFGFIIPALIGLCIFAIPGIIIIIWKCVSHSKKIKLWKQEKEDYEKNHGEVEKTRSEALKKRSDVLQKARSLV